MGFLNHATNNIIIDAVLTERGRELLSKNDGSFSIEAFSFGDDEVDYSLLTKYGKTIGKEKIIKNTPIFEANPNENIAIKHPLISFPNPLTRISQLPTLIRATTTENTTVTIFDTREDENSNTGVEGTISVKTSLASINSGDTLDPSITDNRFLIRMHGSLLKITSDSNATFIDTDLNGVDTYEITTSSPPESSDWVNQKYVSFKVFAIGVVTADSFARFSTIGNNRKINTSVQIIGESSGASIVVPVQVTKR